MYIGYLSIFLLSISIYSSMILFSNFSPLLYLPPPPSLLNRESFS